MTRESREDRILRLENLRGVPTRKIQARDLKAGMRFVSDNRWRKMKAGRVYTIKDVESFGEGRDMRWTIDVSACTKLMLRSHETLDVIP